MSARTSRPGRRALGLVAAAGLLAAVGAGPATGAAAAPGEPGAQAGRSAVDPLRGADRAKLARAVAEGRPTVTVMVVASRSEVARARSEVRRLGGTLRYAADELGYFSAVVPTGEVEQAAALPSVEALDLDETVPLPQVRPDGARTRQPAATGGPGAGTADDNPFLPTRDTGSVAFKRQHPTWDGRGTTIGVLDSGIDLAHPALQRTSTGERKVVDSFTATSPYDGDGTWRAMLTSVTSDGTFSAAGTTWTAAPGTYRFDRFAEASTDAAGGEVLGDVDRDGGRDDVWGVLLDPRTDDVIVDVDQDADFTDEVVRRPYGERGQVGTFGTDDPATEVVEAMPFTVDVLHDVDLRPLGGTGTADFVDIGLVSGAHGSHVAGIAAANGMFGGAMDGQAPGAQLVSARACTFRPGCTAAALTDGMAELAAHRGVDVINTSIGSLPALNDGDSARAALYRAIIAKGVQIVASAGNAGNALNTVSDPAVGTDVVSVGASISRATWKANYGADVAAPHSVLTFSSGGPREDGGLEPDVTAPGSAVSTTPTWQPGRAVPEAGYALPAGYAMFAGTSMAAPQATGALALLLSAAGQQGVKDTSPAALRAAVASTAQHDPSIPAFLQGHGGVDVVGAWSLLERGPVTDRVAVRAPVCTELWRLLGRTSGTGVHDRCDARAGTPRTYPVTVTRTSGRVSGTYAVSLVGDDGTFSVSPSSVALPVGRAVTVLVTATPEAGASTALLRLDDGATPGVDVSAMLAVVVGTDLGAAPSSTTATGTSQRNAVERHYVTVAPGTRALQLELTGLAARTQTRFLAYHPFGLPVDPTASTDCYSNRGTDATCDPARRVYADPQPGVWEVLVETRRTSPVASTAYSLTSTALG